MDIFRKLILIKSNKTQEFEDKTAEIIFLKHSEQDKIAVTYLNKKTYNYNSSKVIMLKNPKEINIDNIIICVEGVPVSNPLSVLAFGEYIKIINNKERVKTYHNSKISYQKSCLDQKKSKSVFDYFKKISAHVNGNSDFGDVLLKQYQKIVKINENSVLATYLSGDKITMKNNKDTLIFPFGFNLSQKQAVKTALERKISIIEGPPGTGKTQTILNIIANIVAKGETVAIVAGNNSATSNVQEKLIKDGYGFITALLGNVNNQKDFFLKKQVSVPEIKGWAIENEQIKKIARQLSSISNDLDNLLEDKNKISKLREEVSKLEVEESHFKKSFNDLYIPSFKFSFRKKWSSESILDFIVYYKEQVLANKNNKMTVKAYLFIRYGIYKFEYFNKNKQYIINSLKRDYYTSGIEERKQRIASLQVKIEGKNYEKLMDQYIDQSKKLFKAALYEKYSKEARNTYTIRTFKYNFKKFIGDFPVILSTTNSIMNSIPENYLFDYLIIDEASQVDLVTASLAFACCKNVVIVGDVKQLPQIISSQIEKISNEIFYDSDIQESYNYSKQSIIKSLMNLYKTDLPQTLLSEHYRCHPKIIGFCNEKFYNNKLVIMTEENTNDMPLKIYKTAPGNHARKGNLDNGRGWYNLRQIEVIRDEIIDKYKEQYQDCSGVGIICPYRSQVNETTNRIKYSQIEVDTVHKYQGREKDTIIFSTVVNDINSFVDDANLINVAVSRSVKELIVVTSGKLFKRHGSNIGDLIRYIEYNSPEEAVIESQKISVFDLMYSEYSYKLLKVMNSSENISKYKSENLMYSVIKDVLGFSEFSSFKCVIHIPLNSIVKDYSMLNQEERKFVQNPWAHVDFLIFNKLDKEAAAVVEVDGYAYHHNNEKQLKRDALKDKILGEINLPILRIATNESGEKEKLIKILNDVVRQSGKINESELIDYKVN